MMQHKELCEATAEKLIDKLAYLHHHMDPAYLVIASAWNGDWGQSL